MTWHCFKLNSLDSVRIAVSPFFFLTKATQYQNGLPDISPLRLFRCPCSPEHVHRTLHPAPPQLYWAFHRRSWNGKRGWRSRVRTEAPAAIAGPAHRWGGTAAESRGASRPIAQVWAIGMHAYASFYTLSITCGVMEQVIRHQIGTHIMPMGWHLIHSS